MASKLSIVFLAICAVIFTCNAATMQKRDTETSSVLTDANDAIDKIFENLNKGIKQLADDGVDFEGILQNITSKATQLTDQIQSMGKELGAKVQEAAKQQGIGA